MKQESKSIDRKVPGATFAREVARRAEVVAVAALTAPTRCEQLLQSCATALVHESALEFQAEAAAPAQPLNGT